MKLYKRLSASIVIATGATILASCESLPAPAGEYKFELIGSPSVEDHRTSISVRVVHTDSSPVVGAEVYVEYWVYGGPKNSPNHLQRLELHADPMGRFVYTSDNLHEGDMVHLAARVIAGTALVRGTVTVP